MPTLFGCRLLSEDISKALNVPIEAVRKISENLSTQEPPAQKTPKIEQSVQEVPKVKNVEQKPVETQPIENIEQLPKESIINTQKETSKQNFIKRMVDEVYKENEPYLKTDEAKQQELNNLTQNFTKYAARNKNHVAYRTLFYIEYLL